MPTFAEIINGRIGTVVDLLDGQEVVAILTVQFNLKLRLGLNEILSMLFYTGYATIDSDECGMGMLKIPNQATRTLLVESLKAIMDLDLPNVDEGSNVPQALRLIGR